MENKRLTNSLKPVLIVLFSTTMEKTFRGTNLFERLQDPKQDSPQLSSTREEPYPSLNLKTFGSIQTFLSPGMPTGPNIYLTRPYLISILIIKTFTLIAEASLKKFTIM